MSRDGAVGGARARAAAIVASSVLGALLGAVGNHLSFAAWGALAAAGLAFVRRAPLATPAVGLLAVLCVLHRHRLAAGGAATLGAVSALPRSTWWLALAAAGALAIAFAYASMRRRDGARTGDRDRSSSASANESPETSAPNTNPGGR